MDTHGETQHQRRDRELNELLQEIRVTQPGVQVLFGFLLILPFQERFGVLPGRAQSVLTATLLAAALAGVLLSAPTNIHRLNFRAHNKEWIVQTSHRCIAAGSVALAFAMTGAVFVVVTALEGMGWATVATIGTALTLGLLWFTLPLRSPRQRADD